MEFIIVLIKGQPDAEVRVVINGEIIGTTGSLITLGSPGVVSVSVDLPGAQQQTVEVRDTTPEHPMTVEIPVIAQEPKGVAGKGGRTKERKKAPKETETMSPEENFLSGPAGYTSEFCGVGGNRPVTDYLNVETMADRLAELIALRETKLPLAIGLFGNWGSGKSHFMNLIDRKLKNLAKETPEEGPWCREIVPIYFNAWHYMDTNLWASLVSQIFESLFAHLRPKHDLAKVQELLEQASGATARASEEVALAHTATESARGELLIAQESRRSEETIINSLLHGLRNLLPNVEPTELRRITQLLDVEKEIKTLGELREVLDEAHSLGGRFRMLLKAAKREGWKWRVVWLVTAVGLAILLPTIAASVFPVIKGWFHGRGENIARLFAAVPVLVAWMRPILAQASRGLKKMENWEKQAEAAQEQARETPAVKKARANVTAAAANEEAAKIRLAESESRERQLSEEAQALSPERRLSRFIEQRAQSSDYRGQLGLVSLARRDFQELSDTFADTEALKEKVAKLRKSTESDARLKADQIEELSKSIDRIVLFVDDLDRCQPEKVADVLQAVHLLLAYPLFAVVVGVDQRCLKQSIVKQFRGLMSPGDGIQDGRNATPLDYLEKIFHVPFHLPMMNEVGFATLIEKLTEPTPSAPIASGIASKPPPDSGSVAGPPKTARVIGSVSLTPWERVALKDYHPLVRTPRGATRLLNTYRLVRAGIPLDEWISFRGDETNGEFRVAMLLLASAAGFPAVAREWFATLRNADPTALFLDDSKQSTSKEWMQFKKVYDATFVKSTPQPTKELFAKWLDRVERFAF